MFSTASKPSLYQNPMATITQRYASTTITMMVTYYFPDLLDPTGLPSALNLRRRWKHSGLCDLRVSPTLTLFTPNTGLVRCLIDRLAEVHAIDR
jgi:hypothetical protein